MISVPHRELARAAAAKHHRERPLVANSHRIAIYPAENFRHKLGSFLRSWVWGGDAVPELSQGDFENLLAFRTSLRRFLHWSQSQARAVGLTPAQHQLLVAVKGHPGQDPTISELTRYLLLRHHSVVELVDRAEAAGLVKRRGDSDDGRLTRIRLTRDGEGRLSRLTPTHLNELRNLAPILNQLVASWSTPEQAGPASPAGPASRGKRPSRRPGAAGTR